MLRPIHQHHQGITTLLAADFLIVFRELCIALTAFTLWLNNSSDEMLLPLVMYIFYNCFKFVFGTIRRTDIYILIEYGDSNQVVSSSGTFYASVGRAPEAYGSLLVCVGVWVSFHLLPAFHITH